MSTNLTASLSRITDDIADFYHGMRDYWSTRTLMQGYGEAAKDITEFVEDATKDSNPLVQACAGSGLAVAKMLGAIPIGIDHWVIETARSMVHQGVGAGFKTLLGTPIEGFVDGGKFVLNQANHWSRGEISHSTMGVADEVASTLGTVGLMFLGIKGIHTGGTGLINGLKNIELPTPALATSTGHVMPVALGAEAISGVGPMAEGLVFMAASKKDGGSGGFWRPKKGAGITPEFIATLDKLAKAGDPHAAQLLNKLAEPGPPPSPVDAALMPGYLPPPETKVIPAGLFKMGAKDLPDSQPVRGVYVSEFEIGKYLVTNGEYAEYLSHLGKNRFAVLKTDLETGLATFVGWEGSKSTAEKLADKILRIERAGRVAVKTFEIPEELPSPRGFNHERQPVVNVNWNEATAFTAAVDGRLPTEAEWKKAAVGPKGDRYGTQSGGLSKAEAHYDANATAKVGSYPPNGYGLHDMTGNAWEWTGDWYQDSYRGLPNKNPIGPAHGEYKVLSGGSWHNPDGLRADFRGRGYPVARNDDFGFRVVVPVQDSIK